MKIKPIHAFFMGIIGLGFGLMVDNMIATTHVPSDKSQYKNETIDHQPPTDMHTSPIQENNKSDEPATSLELISIKSDQETKTGEILSRIGYIS